ncbi:MAG TPA: transglycosylase SLT domain-containing protein [Longimicrobiales bacterium]|nr:transglycosylase SLT domain-containing protein [Longimicrobiales bacterium]
MKRALLLLLLIGCSKPDSKSANNDESDEAAPVTATPRLELGNEDFQRGAQLLKASDWIGAERAFEKARTTSPDLEEWATYYQAYAAAQRGDTTRTLDLFKDLESSFQREWAWRARVTSFERARAFARGSGVADSAAARLNGPVRRSEALLRSAQLHLAGNDTSRAFSAARLALKAAGNSPTGRAAADIMAKRVRNPDDVMLVARAYYSTGSYAKAIPFLRRANASLMLGQAYYSTRKYPEAIKTLTPLAKKKSVQAQLLIARSYLRSRKAADAVKAARATIALSPSGSSAAASYFMIADLADDVGDKATAANNYRGAIKASPRSDYGVNAFMRLGTNAMVARDYKGAAAIFKQFADAHGQTGSSQQANFWLAQAHAANGNKAEATALLKRVQSSDAFTYYGLLAAKQLGVTPALGAKGPVTSDSIAKIAKQATERIHVLKSVGFPDASAFELYRATQQLKTQSAGTYALAEQMVARNEAAAAMRLGLQTRKQESAWNQRLLRIVFPMPFEDLIVREATKNKIDPFLVAALIRQESTFDPLAMSGVGAVGLMQVMPATANRSTQQLRDAETNVRIGTAHLKMLIDQYRGQPAYLLAAYNAGQTPVGRWLKLPGSSDPLIFAERVPYEETRGYVKIVQRNAWVYRLLYSQPD